MKKAKNRSASMTMPSTTARTESREPFVPLPNAMGIGPIRTNPPVEALPPTEDADTTTKPTKINATPTTRNNGRMGQIT